MRNVILFCLLCCSLSLAQVQPVTEKAEEKWVEPTGWKNIHWQPDAISALQQSKLSGKPLMVFMIVNYKGRAEEDRA